MFKRFAMAMLVLAAVCAPPAKAFPQAQTWPMMYAYDAPGMRVTMTAECHGEYGLIVRWDLIATDTTMKRVEIDLDYAGHFERTRWDNLTPISPGANLPARSAEWAPERAGRWASITLSGWAPCSTRIGPLRSTYISNRYWLARIMHK